MMIDIISNPEAARKGLSSYERGMNGLTWAICRHMQAYARIMTACYCATMRAATRKIGALYDEALAPFGLNIAQYALLRKIQRLQPLSLTQLGQEIGLDRSTMSRNVKVLEKAGLAATAKGEADQREAMASLTPLGAARLSEALPAWEKSQQAMESRLGAEKLKAFGEILSAL